MQTFFRIKETICEIAKKAFFVVKLSCHSLRSRIRNNDSSLMFTHCKLKNDLKSHECLCATFFLGKMSGVWTERTPRRYV